MMATGRRECAGNQGRKPGQRKGRRRPFLMECEPWEANEMGEVGWVRGGVAGEDVLGRG